jgi:hypothetical protein
VNWRPSKINFLIVLGALAVFATWKLRRDPGKVEIRFVSWEGVEPFQTLTVVIKNGKREPLTFCGLGVADSTGFPPYAAVSQHETPSRVIPANTEERLVIGGVPSPRSRDMGLFLYPYTPSEEDAARAKYDSWPRWLKNWLLKRYNEYDDAERLRYFFPFVTPPSTGP